MAMALRRISYASSSVKLLRPLSNGSSLYYMVHKYFFPEKLLITEAVDIQFVIFFFFVVVVVVFA